MSETGFARSETSAGAVLAAAREELNLSVYDVARYLKISPAQVEALEEGAYERLPGRVFVRGFLRNYAKFLGIDAQPLLRSIEEEMPQPKVKVEPPPSPEVVMPHGEPVRWPLYAGFTAITIVGALAVYEFGFNEASRPAPREEGVSAAAPTPPEGVSPAPPVAAAGAVASNPLPSAAEPSIGTSTQSSVPSSFPELPGAEPAKTAIPGERELAFRFEGESWVEIRDRDGKVIFSKLNRAGNEERVRGMPPFKLVIGNARGVQLNYDQQPVDLAPHIAVSVARLTLQ